MMLETTGSNLAAAIQNGTPLPPVTPPTVPMCCVSVVDGSSLAGSAVGVALGLDITGLSVPLGLSCSPITVVGNNCGGISIICDVPEQEWGGLFTIKCLPITL
ncbi:hypothetical protein DFH08DRAFT_799034 [Mycena albidolilacea]|uniref:Hydrophobin n=1 Tax=Mycena albidolilacea TaxID=1033008 RepID=A0AAD7F2I7_9AGAR|nr:hypothetical protein DFH08DRAFT_799034 [Mycena albidolilacea]